MLERDLMNRKITLSFTGWVGLVFGLLLVIATAGEMIWPIMTAPVRVLIAMTVLAGVVTVISLVGKFAAGSRKRTIWSLTTLTMLILLSALSSRPPSQDGLRQAYLSQLNSYSGSPYVWGGETGRGIDCSGLARTAMWQAMAVQGVRTANPRLLGPMLWRFWWRDLSAHGMLDQEHGYTRRIGSAEKLAGYDCSALQVGDLAVSEGGVHVLIYAGDGKWIEANPEDGKVVTNAAALDSDRPYFNMNMTFLRWWLFN